MDDDTNPDETSERKWSGILAVYTVCYSRWQSNTSLQWQALAYILAAQGALLAAVLVTKGVTSIILGLTCLVFGSLGVILMQRIELTAWWDRERLDTFEKLLLPDNPELRLLHDMNLVKRFNAQPSPSQSRRLRNPIRRVEFEITRRAHPSIVAMGLVLLVGGVSVLAGFIK